LHGNAGTRSRSLCDGASLFKAVRQGVGVFLHLNRNPKSYLFAVIGAEYILKLLPKGTHEYAKFIRPSELMRFCRDAGLEPDVLIGMTYNPFTKRYALGNDTSVNYTLSARKPS
jgi:2-polyprenyl-6-hydroxyphenyl methylase / 3-demethylubiquinone-9 3-methyltransferase